MIEVVVVALCLAVAAMAAALCVTVVVLARKLGQRDTVFLDTVIGNSIQAFNNGVTIGQDRLVRASGLPGPASMPQEPPSNVYRPDPDEPAEIGRV